MTSQKRTFSDLIVDYLELFGVEYVFGVSGVHIMGLYEALSRSERRGGPRAIQNRHESGAVFTAAGYAIETGKIGVCCVTAGPGAAQAINGVAVANADHVPLLIISGQTRIPQLGRGGIQESSTNESQFPDIMDTIGMLELCTRYNSQVTHPAQLEWKLTAALTVALTPLKGPAHLCIPHDIVNMPCSDSISYPHLAENLYNSSAYLDTVAFERLWETLTAVLERQGQVVLYVGFEAAGAGAEITAVAELINAPIVTTVPGQRWVNPYHPLVQGRYGPRWGHKTAFDTLHDDKVDLILAIGMAFDQDDTAGWTPDFLNQPFINIHPTSTYFGRAPMAKFHLMGTPKLVFQTLLERLQKKLSIEISPRQFDTTPNFPPQIAIYEPEEYFSDATPIKPQRVIYELWRNFPAETRFVVDIGNSTAWISHYLFLAQPENFRMFFEQSSMGSSPGQAVGTAMGAPGVPVVCLIGDAAFQMSGQEISVAVAEELPIIFVILNDSTHGMVINRHRQIGQEPVNLEFPRVDFKLMAESVGAQGFTINTVEDFAAIDYQALINRRGPTILDVYIDKDKGLPMTIADNLIQKKGY